VVIEYILPAHCVVPLIEWIRESGFSDAVMSLWAGLSLLVASSDLAFSGRTFQSAVIAPGWFGLNR
jgi:hypothetical protein